MVLLVSLLFLGACGAQTKAQELGAIQDILARLETDQQELIFRVNALEQRILNLHGIRPTASAQAKIAVQQALNSMQAQPSTPTLPKTTIVAQPKVHPSYPKQTVMQAQTAIQAPPLALLPSPDAEIAAGKYRLIDPNKSKGTVASNKPNAKGAPAKKPSQQRALVPVKKTQAAVQAAPQKPSKKVNGKVEQEYADALQQYRLGNYTTAITLFETLRKNYPNHTLATNFLYWIGESLYALNQDIDAIFTFKNIASSQPKHQKAPDALLKTALSYRRLGDTQNADAHIRILLEDYPNSPAAKRATKLNQL